MRKWVQAWNVVPECFVQGTWCSSSSTFSTKFLWFYKTMRTTAVFSFFSLLVPFSRPPILGGSLPLYTSFQSILTLHLLILQAITRVLVPSATFSNLLWVATTKAILFRGPFIINAARTLVGHIKCGGDSFSFNCSYSIPTCASCCTRPFFEERSGRLPLMVCRSFPLESGTLRTESSSATSLDHLDFQRMSSDISLLGAGLGLSIEWAGVAKFSGPTIALQNPTVCILGQRGGFW